MDKAIVSAFCLGVFFLSSTPLVAETPSPVAVFVEPGFPAADSAGPSAQQLQKLMPSARFASIEQLKELLNTPSTRLLVLPYGSAFPEESWPDIYTFLQRGGNLLVLGGQPFTRAAYRDSRGWKLRDYSVRFTRPLMIDQYQLTPGSDGLEFETNAELTLQLPRFAWKRAFSPVIRLSAVALYQRGGSAGSIDARNPQQPSIAIVSSQAAQFSMMADFQLDAQRKAVRALAYYDRLACYAIAENQIEKLGAPKLAILPSPQALADTTWNSLLKYINDGGNLLVTGPVDRDEHWHPTMRAAEFERDAQAEPLTYHNATMKLGEGTVALSFDQGRQNCPGPGFS